MSALHKAPPVHRDLELSFDTLADGVRSSLAHGEKPQVLAIGKGLMLLALQLAKTRGLKVAFLSSLGRGSWFVCSRESYQKTDWALVCGRAAGRAS